MSDFNLDRAPEFGKQHPELYVDIYGTAMPQDPDVAVALAIDHLRLRMSYYDETTGLSAPLADTGSCVTRSLLLQTLLSPLPSAQTMLGVRFNVTHKQAHGNTICLPATAMPIVIDSSYEERGDGKLIGTVRVTDPAKQRYETSKRFATATQQLALRARNIKVANCGVVSRPPTEQKALIVPEVRANQLAIFSLQHAVNATRIYVFDHRTSNDIVDGRTLPDPSPRQKFAAELYKRALRGEFLTQEDIESLAIL